MNDKKYELFFKILSGSWVIDICSESDNVHKIVKSFKTRGNTS